MTLTLMLQLNKLVLNFMIDIDLQLMTLFSIIKENTKVKIVFGNIYLIMSLMLLNRLCRYTFSVILYKRKRNLYNYH
jgi:hypothetical protein